MRLRHHAGASYRPGRSLRAVLAAACTLALVAAGCGGSDDSETTTAATTAARTGGGAGTVVVADQTVASSLDPDGPDSQVVANLNVFSNVYEPLLRFSRVENEADLGGGRFIDPSRLEPALAESWDARGNRAVFRLRRGVRSSHGNEFTAADVVWSFQRALANRATGAFNWGTIAKVRDVRALDDYTVEVTTDGPSPMLLADLASSPTTWPIDSRAVRQNAAPGDRWGRRWLRENTAGFGPFVVSRWDRPQSITLEPRDDYYGDPAQATIRMMAIADPSSRLTTLQQGDIDAALNLTPQQINDAGRSDGLHLYRFRGNTLASVMPNFNVPELRDPKVRQAMWYATPSEDIIRTVYMGNAFPLTSVLPWYVEGSGDYADYPYDPERAKRLLAEAGYPNGFSSELLYASESPTLAAIATILQSSWEEAGIRVRLTPQPIATLVTRAFGERDLPIWLTDTATATMPDASIIGALYSSTGFANVSNYDNPAFDRAYREADSSLDMAERMPGIEEMQRQAADDPVYIMVAGLYATIATRDGVENWGWNPDQSQNFRQVAVK